MRIIAGELRGRRIEAPEGRETRPMLDRVREALFSTLSPWLEGGRVLDLFAGSGSLGLEAVSRGARAARLVESGAGQLELLRRNVRALGVEERVQVVGGDALAPASWGGGERYDLVFLDPPYAMLREAQSRRGLLDALHALVREALAPDAVLVLHAPARALEAGELGEGLEVAERRYGTNALWYVQRRGGQGEEG
jgi:16S rRNA (guanine966-N2)-methyltransferase